MVRLRDEDNNHRISNGLSIWLYRNGRNITSGEGFSLNDYLGKWYKIAGGAHSFDPGLSNVRLFMSCVLSVFFYPLSEKQEINNVS
jgi:hypothetical protein